MHGKDFDTRAGMAPGSSLRHKRAVLLLLILLLIAPAIGSFLGVLIRRLPAGRPVALARSCCEACGTALGPADLVPLVSYALLRGRCRHCRAPIDPFHLRIELVACLVPPIVFLAAPDPAALLIGSTVGWWLLALAWIDASSLLLPDLLTLPLLAAGLAMTASLDPARLGAHAVAAGLGWGGLALLAALYHRVRGRAGLGLGDAKLLGAGGAWLGPGMLPFLLLGGALGTLAGAGLSRLAGRRITATTRLPLGPALAAAIWIGWLVQAAVGPAF